MGLWKVKERGGVRCHQEREHYLGPGTFLGPSICPFVGLAALRFQECSSLLPESQAALCD